ncbi:MAG TPA: exopolysaccharide transport family protein [Xanthobacteraceae bacterium]|nr:exopolysaccharide transport family protein [Xanthobacteraceae bacterium]
MALIEAVPHRPVRSAGLEEPRPAPAAVIDLRDIFAIVQRQRGWILWPVIVCTMAALVVALALPTRYTATAQILLDVKGLRVLQSDLTPRAEQSGDTQLADAESQLQVVSSGGVLTSVVEREKLQDDPEFGAATPGLLSSIIDPDRGPEDRVLKAMRSLQRRLGVRRPDKTFVLDVSVWSEEPAKAARIANAIATVYLEQELASKTDAAKRTNAALVSRLAELGERVSRSAHRVEDYKAQNRIIGASGQLVNEQQLSELNNQLVLARTVTAEQRARYEDIQRLQRNHSEPDTIAEVTGSATITALRSKYAEAKQAEANASAILGPRHPSVAAAAAQVEQSRRLIDEEVSRIANTALSEYNRAYANEEALERNLEMLKGDAVSTNQALVRLRELEREAESDRAVYAAFLNRAKEVGEQEGVNDSNSRIITRAIAPTTKSGPPRMLIVAGSLVIGLIAGLGLALLRDQFDPVIRSQRQLAAEFGMRVLAIVPDLIAASSPVFARASRQSAAMQRLRSALRSARPTGDATVVLVTSPDSPDARSVVALNLAIRAGGDGERVLLVDGDRQQQAMMLAVRDEDGEEQERLTSLANRVVRTPWERVKFLRVSPPAGNDRQMAYDLRDAVMSRVDKFDLIVVDGGLLSSDPVVRTFPAPVDDIVIVVERGRTRRDHLREGLEALGANEAKLSGAVLAD